MTNNFKAGFVSFVGRPNVGKSSLTNALVGEKIAITSSKPQTTRKVIRAVINRADTQIILVDTPGIHRPRTLLGERLNTLVSETLSGVDVIGFCIPANEDIGPGDRFINEQLDDYPHAKKIAIVTKTDEASRDRVIQQLALLDQMRDWEALVPVARDNEDQLSELVSVIRSKLPDSPMLYDPETVTEESYDDRVAELIRETALEGAREELPHSLAVVIDEVFRDEEERLNIYANLIVERDSQKGIIIGTKGSKLSALRQRSRSKIKRLLGEPVNLFIQVKVLKDWQKDPKHLQRLGF